ncbi:MAG: insulinase family protein [bacterium]|nr:insulinase family protein [bacterium]
MKKFFSILVILMAFSLMVQADFDFSKIKNSVSEFTLSNGLKFILVEDHAVPIASFQTYVNVGGSDERIGIFGISHFLEHMAFKGTTELGTTNYEAEKKLFAKMDALFTTITSEEDSLNPDQEKLKGYKEEMKKLMKEATTHVVNNEPDKILEQAGAVGINAGTSKDYTKYYLSLPSNKLELWAYIEASRYIDPVFRDFYKERGVIQEERRMRVDNSPIGKLLEELLAVSFKDHTYRVNGVGPMSNIDRITRSDMYSYFRTNYTAKNMVIGVYGDVTPAQLKKVAKKYFSKMRSGRRNSFIYTTEPEQQGEKSVTILEDTQPMVIVAFHIPSVRHEDHTKMQVLNYILSNGRSSRLRKRMTIDDKIAMNVFAMTGYPGSKYTTLFIIGAMPNIKHTNDEMLKVIDEEVAKLLKEPIPLKELDAAKTRMKVNIIRGMKSGTGLLSNLLSSEVVLGSWKKGFDELKDIEKVTTKDIQEMVKKYFIRTNRTIGRIEKKEVKK